MSCGFGPLQGMPAVKTNTVLGQLTLLGATLTVLLGFASAQAASGDTYIVTTAGDTLSENPCPASGAVFICNTLRDAITVAQNDENGATINFAITDTTIMLSGPLPQISHSFGPLTIDGTSQNITVSGAVHYQVMIIYGGTVTINALTIANGNCSSAECNGGAIGVYNAKGCAASLAISNSTFSGNSASVGGAIYSYCPVTVVNSTFYNNSATASGGGAIYIDGAASLKVTDSTFSTNTTSASGSAIDANDLATVTLSNTILAAELGNGVPNPAGNCFSNEESSPFTDGGGNLSDDNNNTCNFNTGEGATSAYGVNDTGTGGLNLVNNGVPANYGGPTETIALASNSAAISSGVNCPATPSDQRGASRPALNCSSGALQFPVTSTTTSSTGTVAGCTAPAVCNLSGGDSQTVAAGTTQAASELSTIGTDSITENLCIIAEDPREICGANSHTPHHTKDTTFPVSEFCGASFGNTVVPDYLCGAYSSNGPEVPPETPNNGLAVLQGIGDPVNDIPGLLWLNDANPDVYFDFSPSGQYASECNSIGLAISPLTGNPDGISVAWAPWSGSAVEGTIPEGPRATEVTDGCGGGKNPGPGVSITLIGVTMNLSNAVQELGSAATRNSPTVNLIEFAEYKYANLFADVSEANIPTSNKAHLLAIITQSALFLAAGNHACAETTLYDADNYVVSNANLNIFLGNSVDPNSYGRTRTRLLNLFYTLYTRLDGQPNPITNLAVAVDFPLLAPGFTPPVCSKPHL